MKDFKRKRQRDWPHPYLPHLLFLSLNKFFLWSLRPELLDRGSSGVRFGFACGLCLTELTRSGQVTNKTFQKWPGSPCELPLCTKTELPLCTMPQALLQRSCVAIVLTYIEFCWNTNLRIELEESFRILQVHPDYNPSFHTAQVELLRTKFCSAVVTIITLFSPLLACALNGNLDSQLYFEKSDISARVRSTRWRLEDGCAGIIHDTVLHFHITCAVLTCYPHQTCLKRYFPVRTFPTTENTPVITCSGLE